MTTTTVRLVIASLLLLLSSDNVCDSFSSSVVWRIASSSSSLSYRGGVFQRPVATVLEDGGNVSGEEDGKGNNRPKRQQKQQRLSRPERKKLERERKAMKKNRKKSNHSNSKNADGSTTTYTLHSQAVPELTSTSTADDVLRSIKRAQRNLNDYSQHHNDNRMNNDGDLGTIARFLLEQTDPTYFYGYRGSLLARLAVAALHRKNHGLAQRVLHERQTQHADSTRLPMEAAAIIRGLLRVHNVTDAWEILNEELPWDDDDDNNSSNNTAVTTDHIRYRALSLASIISRHFFEGEPVRAVAACETLARMGPAVRNCADLASSSSNFMPWTRLLRGAAQCQSMIRENRLPYTWENTQLEAGNVKLPCNVVYAVLGCLATFPKSSGDTSDEDRIYEMISNALVRRVVFVTGAVSMAGCPVPDRGEACFIGRSNVGKSSLINMITARKSLAYTSKRPGKTQQFNYFAINDAPGKEKEIKYGDVLEGEKDSDSFYIVDLPGFGYAKVPEKQRQEWLAFMQEYLAHRRTLRTVFHLVDGRHGPTEEDGLIMNQVSSALQKDVSYVVVLTKADKNVKGADKNRPGKVSDAVMNSLRTAMRKNGIKYAPVILTSAETKLGRDDLWRYLRKAAEAF